jgi:membrane protease YdiL (CAAX protease family)
MSNDSSKHLEATTETASSRSVLPHPVMAFVLTLGTFLASSVVAGLILGVILDATGGNKADPPELFGSATVLQFAYMLLAYGLMFGVVVLHIRRNNYSFKALGLRRPKWLKDIGLAALAFLVYMGAYIVLTSIVQITVPDLNLDQKQDIGFDNAHGLTLVFIFLMLVVVVPFVEEFLMRGLLFSSLRQRLPYWVSALVTSGLFASLHLGGGEAGAGPLWVAAIDTFVLSLVLCYLRERTGRLWAGIGLHAIKNSIAFAALFIFVSSST